MGESPRDRLEAMVRANSRLDLTRVEDGQCLNFELGYDSHALLNLLLDVEDGFGVEVPPEEVPDLVGRPFADLLALVEERMQMTGGRDR